MKIQVLAAAWQDLLDGSRFYDRQSRGVGSYFLVTLIAEIDSLGVNAGIHPILFGRYHGLLSRRFPFAVYYRIEDDTVRVYAVLDCRRSPALDPDHVDLAAPSVAPDSNLAKTTGN